MMFFLDQGPRLSAHDRPGHGRSSHTSAGHDMDTCVAALAEALNLRDAIHVGHSTGEVARYVARRGEGRVAKAAMISAVAPIMTKSERNLRKAYPGLPHGMPTTHADRINADLLAFVRG